MQLKIIECLELIPLSDEIIERLTKVETVQNEHTKLLNAQIEKNEALLRIEVLMERQIEDSRKRDDQMEKFESTLLKVNDNLTNLNTKQELMDERVTGIEDSIKEKKKKHKSILVSSLKYIGSLLVGIGLAVLYKKLGL